MQRQNAQLGSSGRARETSWLRGQLARAIRVVGALSLVLVFSGCPDSSGSDNGGPEGENVGAAESREFSASGDCKTCHPRQFEEWRASPHAYTGVSPTFYSLVAAGMNGAVGFGTRLDTNEGNSTAGAVGNFCLPCHAPIGFMGLDGAYTGNNGGFGQVNPQGPYVCDPRSPMNALEPCTRATSNEICGQPNLCSQWTGPTCINAPPQTPGVEFPRQIITCDVDADCPGNSGPCIIGPAALYYSPEAQDGINCEVCHNSLPNHRRSCQLFRDTDSVAVMSLDIAERDTPEGRRLRVGPYPLSSIAGGQGVANDMLNPVLNAFHESARVDTPLVVPYDETDRRNGIANPTLSPHILRPTELTCEELPYCRRPNPVGGGICEGGLAIGAPCTSDFDCGGCGGGVCGPGGARAGLPCMNSVDCGTPADPSQNLIERGLSEANPTIHPLLTRPINAATNTPGDEIDSADGNYFRSSMMCGACHDVRPGGANAILRSCQLQSTAVCATDADCVDLNVGCPGNDCGPCVMENNTSPANIGDTFFGPQTFGDPSNAGYRRVENLFTEWQISLYNHPELTYCQGDSFIACTDDADCGADGPCNVSSPYGDQVITCQDCHMSNFPRTPLIEEDGSVVAKNDLYPKLKAAVEGAQSDPSVPLPVRRVSTHNMAGVDLPLIRFPGQGDQALRRQELVDSAFKIELEETPATAEADEKFEVKVVVENVGVGHRVPAGFSHERQFWIQLFVQESEALGGLDPFDPAAPCNLQGTIATGPDQADDILFPNFEDDAGALALGAAGCVYRSGFILDKAHPETREMTPDGSFDDEDPEDFFVVVGTRVRGDGPSAIGAGDGDPRIEVTPGAEGRALQIQNICAEATEEAYLEGIQDGTGIDYGTVPGFPNQVRFCDPLNSPGQAAGFTAAGFGNPDCMDGAVDTGPCVPEIELSDGNERGRCAKDLTKGLCQNDAECGDDGPCLFRCLNFPELECCDTVNNPDCADFYVEVGLVDDPADAPSEECRLEGPPTSGFAHVCVGGVDSGAPCDVDGECTSNNCGRVGPCNIENRGIVNYQGQFRSTANSVCSDPATGEPVIDPATGDRMFCLVNLNCVLSGAPPGSVCGVFGQCAEDAFDGSSFAEDLCTNPTYRNAAPVPAGVSDDFGCGLDAPGGNPIACNVEFNLELNGRPSESVGVQNHPYNFNSLPPLQPREYDYDFTIPAAFAGKRLVVAARILNRHFPMRFLRNLVGTQVVRPPFIFEGRGDPDDPNQCNGARSIDLDCFVRPLSILGNAEVGGFVPEVQATRTRAVEVE